MPRSRTAMVWVIAALLLTAFFVFEHRNGEVSRLDGFAAPTTRRSPRPPKGTRGGNWPSWRSPWRRCLSLRREGRRWELGSWLGWLLLGYYTWCMIGACWSVDPPLTVRHLGLLLLCGVGALGVADKRLFASCA